MKTIPILLSLPLLLTSALAGLETGDAVKITLRGVPPDEQQKVNGEYRVGDSGTIRLPMVPTPLPARGLNPDEFARAAEKAYRDAGIYAAPAIEMEVVGRQVIVEGAQAMVTVGGQVRRSGQVPYRKGMTLIQAVQLAGDRNEYGGRNIRLFRKGKVMNLDFRKPEHKNLLLEPDDAITVDQAGIVEGNRG